MAWTQIAKAGVIFAMITAVVAGVWMGIHAIHDDGRAVERAECLAMENNALTWKQQLLDQAHARNQALLTENLRLNDEVVNNAAKQTEKIHAIDTALRRDPVGLRIPAETCRAEPVSSTTDGASVDHGAGRPDGLRLPSRTEENLYDYALRANRTRIKRNECREWALGIQKMREEWERDSSSDKPDDNRGLLDKGLSTVSDAD